MKGNPWTEIETSMLDGCARAGLSAAECMHLFPDRTEDAVHSKLAQRRKALGIYKPPGRAKGYVVRPVTWEGIAAQLPEQPITTETPEGRASRELLRRHLETGKHWITCPDQFVTICRSVGLAA
jgi:hypothetical protein